MALHCNVRTSRQLALMLLIVVAIYVPLNIFYVISVSLIKGKSGKSVSVTVKRAEAQEDGSIDLTFNVKVADLFKAIGYAGHLVGKEKQNPLPSNFSFVLHNANLCNGEKDLQWLIYVHSSPGNVERRRILRDTWGSTTLFRTKLTRIVFLVGSVDDPGVQRQLNAEFKEYGDIIQGDFREDYRNLTLKGIMGLRWAATYCSNAAFALKADDDAFLDIFRLMDVARKHTVSPNVVICPLWKDNSMPILRDPKKCMKWCVKPHEFRGMNYFPKYCAGLAFLLSKNMLPLMYEASKSTPFFWIDDVYVTGLLMAKVKNVEYVDMLQNFTLKEKEALAQYTDMKKTPTYVYAHVRDKGNFYTMWNSTLQRLPKEKLLGLHDSVLDRYKLREKLK